MSWLFFVAMGVYGAMAIYRWVTNADDKRRAVWREVAQARGGQYHERHHDWRSSEEAIEVDIDQARVYLDLVVDKNSEPRRIYMRCRAQYALLLGPVFHIAPENLLATINKALGGQDVALGVEPAFDQAFVIKCDDPEAVRQVWSQRAMDIMLRSFERATIRSDGRDVQLMVDAGLDDPALVNDVLDLVAEIASADIFGVQALRELPDAVYHPPRGPWNDRSAPFVVVEQPVPVTIGPAVVGRRAVTRATVGDGPRDRPLKLLVRAHGDSEPADGVRELPPAATTWLRKVGDGTLIVDGARTSFTWLRIETDPERLLAGARLLGALSGAPAQGVYR